MMAEWRLRISADELRGIRSGVRCTLLREARKRYDRMQAGDQIILRQDGRRVGRVTLSDRPLFVPEKAVLLFFRRYINAMS